MNRDLRCRLIQAARLEEGFVYYDEVAETLGIAKEQSDRAQELSRELDEISVHEHRQGRPLLSAVVVRAEDRRPDKGFFKMARRVGNYKRGQGKDEFYFTELARVRRYWALPSNWEPELGPQQGSSERFFRPLDGSLGGPRGQFRIAFSTSQSPECSSGHHVTEKFVISDNSRIRCRVVRRRTRLLPLWFRSGRFRAVLREPATEEVVAGALKEGRGEIFLRGKAGIFGGKAVEIERVIQQGGEYYLEVEWGSLIRSWEIRIFEPTA